MATSLLQTTDKECAPKWPKAVQNNTNCVQDNSQHFWHLESPSVYVHCISFSKFCSILTIFGRIWTPLHENGWFNLPIATPINRFNFGIEGCGLLVNLPTKDRIPAPNVSVIQKIPLYLKEGGVTSLNKVQCTYMYSRWAAMKRVEFWMVHVTAIGKMMDNRKVLQWQYIVDIYSEGTWWRS